MQEEQIKWQCRHAPSLGAFEDTPSNIWGVKDYLVKRMVSGLDKPCVFFGLYGLPDFYSLWRHKGRKAILWAGSDIRNFISGYYLDDKGTIKISPKPLATWINKNCESYVENEVEYKALKEMGIETKIVPSFLGNVEDYQISFKPNEVPKLYMSVSGNDFKLYGWDKIYKIARDNPGIEFHLYGNTVPFPLPDSTLFSNIFMHGRVSKEQMNQEIQGMTGALRLTEFDGFSEIIAKSLLWGQWPVSIIKYPGVLELKDIDTIPFQKIPNHKGREWLLETVNKYPWNQK